MTDLWTGGPWEQPSRPVAQPLRIPDAGRPVLRVRKRRRSHLVPVLIAVAVTAIVVLGLVAALLNDLWPNLRLDLDPSPYSSGDYPFAFPYDEYDFRAEEEDVDTPPSIDTAPTGTGVTLTFQPGLTELDYEQIYRRCAPSIVSITATSRSTSSTGTGIVLTEDGYIITNAHVVAGASRVQIVTAENRTADASLVGFDAREDLAVLKVELTGLTPAVFGSSDDLRIGERVAAIGDSLGYRSTITDGIVSALDRDVAIDDVTMTLIQTSAAINFGNSGGALIDRYGRVVGITTVKLVADDGSTESMGFAIPSTRVKYVVDRLIAGEEIVPAVFGITVNTIPVDGSGLEVLTVTNGSDAQAQGIRPGDVLLAVNGQPLTAVEILSRLKCTMGAGDTVVFTVDQDGTVVELTVALTPLSAMEQE